MAEKACHVFTSTTRFGLTQALGGARIMSRSVIGLLLALSVSAVLSLVAYAAMPPMGVPWPTWYGPFRTISGALLAVGPGFTAGWYAGRDGLLLGTILGVITSVGSLAFTWFWWGPMPLDTVAISLVFGSIASIITQSVGGAAGQFVRSGAP